MTITEENYVDKAKQIMEELGKVKDKKGNPKVISTSQIRGILAMTADIYNEVVLLKNNELNESIKNKLQYLRLKFIYEAGRDKCKMKKFVETSKILENLKEIKTKQDYILFSHYMEALVAWRKYKYIEND